MKKKIEVEFFCESKSWVNKMPHIKLSTNNTIKKMKDYFNSRLNYNLNIILSDKKLVKKLNREYKKNNKDTDVLTFVSKISNKNLGKILYCDIFFSIDTIEEYIKKNNISLYDHYKHLLVHSLLHLNGYNHENDKQFNKMKKQEIIILKKIGISNPYDINVQK